MARRKDNRSKKQHGRPPREAGSEAIRLRIIGGRFGGRKLLYHGDPRVRPMKDRVREAVFNLVGPSIRQKHAIDLFAGTGALGLEALSRGAARATLIEQHVPTAGIIRQNIDILNVQSLCDVVIGNVFAWIRRKPELGTEPWVVFSSPPYDLYVEKTDAMLGLIGCLFDSAPAGSIFVVEADKRFDFLLLPDAESWKVRTYPPAVVGIYRKSEGFGGEGLGIRD